MILKVAILGLVAIVIHGANSTDSYFIDVSQYYSAYYNPQTGVGLRPELEDSGRDPLSSPKIAFRGLPCDCSGLSCGCCAGVNITMVNFDRRACTNFTYDPLDFAIKMQVSMNEREIFSNSLSAKNPPPICMPMPYLPFVSFCIRFFDIYMPGKNLHACIDFETRVIQNPILILHFDCVKMGNDGFQWLRPENGEKPQISEVVVYDHVEFENEDHEPINDTTTLTPEQEAMIGQLKLR
ncbi:uncharacterized protein [Prorops nasuta]|uniref:uncharacterized protein n=1 Tax=Prorops nasuta TaxID=863751 RepID=UPI0034CD4F7E